MFGRWRLCMSSMLLLCIRMKLSQQLIISIVPYISLLLVRCIFQFTFEKYFRTIFARMPSLDSNSDMLVSQITTIFKILPHRYAFIGHNELMFCWQFADPGCREFGWRPPRSNLPGSRVTHKQSLTGGPGDTAITILQYSFSRCRLLSLSCYWWPLDSPKVR